MIQLEVGKRYVRRDGVVTGPLREEIGACYPFIDELHGLSYQANGRNLRSGTTHEDLVMEYADDDYDHLGDLQRDYLLCQMVAENQEMGMYDPPQPKKHPGVTAAGVIKIGDRFHLVGGQQAVAISAPTSDTKDTNPKDSIGCTKPPLHTVPTGPLFEAGAVLLHGHCKYRGYNWRVAGVRNSIYYDAVMRHMMAWWEGEDTDPDSGLPHIAHAIAGLCVLRDSQMIGNCTDDRPPRRQHPFNALRPLVAEMAQKPQPEPYTEQNTAEVKP